jgi:glutathione S-transferase
MILYGSSMSPFVRKVLAFAGEKGIALESRPIALGARDPAFLAASPFGKMPAFVDGDFALADSSAIIHYLEALQPTPALIPAEARARGMAIWFDEFADTVLMPCLGKLFFNRVVAPRFLKRAGDAAIAKTAERDELPPLLDYLERVVPAEGYLVGDQLTLADVAVASPLANLTYAGVGIDAERYPRLSEFLGRILARPSFAPWIARERAFLERTSA